MVCLYCGSTTQVVNSRFKKTGLTVWRRRKCSSCGAILTTFENYDLSISLLVKKRSGALQGFQRDKLIISIAKAIDHRQNSSQTVSDLTKTIVNKLLKGNKNNKIISTQDISHMASLVLKRYDAAGSIRYLSYQSPTQGKRDISKMLGS